MMILEDGPCKGPYMVNRAPDYLRAVINAEGKKDVLDQLSDTPAAGEAIHVYQRRPGPVGTASVMLANPRRCVVTVMAEYVHLPDVDGEAFRETAAWRAWASEQQPVAREWPDAD